MFKFTNIALILFITTAINFIATVVSWQRKKAGRGLYFAIAMTGVTLWTLAAGFDYAAVPISLKILFAKAEYTGYNIAFVFFVMFTLSYAGYEEWLDKKFVRVILWFVPISNILLAWSNDWHGWLWSGFVKSEFGDNTVIFEHGPGYLWASATGYLMMTIIILLLWRVWRRGSGFSRSQARLLFFASLIPVVSNLIYVFQNPDQKGVDWSSISFSLSSLLFLWALYGTHFLDLVPVAREKLIDRLSDGVIVLDTQGRIVDLNPAAAQMIGHPHDKLLGGELGVFLPFFKSLIDQPSEQESRTEFEIGDMEPRFFDVLISPLFESQTKIVGRLIIFRDVTSRKQNELRLLQLNQAVEQSLTSIIVTDADGNITYVNPRFTDLTGYTLEEVIGKNPRILKSGQTPPDVYQGLWETIKSGNIWSGELLNKRKNGDLYWERSIISPVKDRDGRILNFIAIKEDATKQHRLEVERVSLIEELKKRNDESESLRETTVIVTSTLNVLAVVERILKQLRRVLAYDTASVWLYDGDITHLVGGDGIPDIPEEDKHYKVGADEPDYPLWTQNIPYILLDDIQENYPQFRKPPINYIRSWMGIPLKVRDQLIGIISLDGKRIGQFTHDDAQLALTYANQVSIALENARLFSDLEEELRHRQRLINELDSANTELAREIEERKRAQDELQSLARTDSLTGLFNRRYFFEIAEKEFAKSVRYDRPLSVVLFDIDLFKEINDTHGHLIGDQALIQIGNLLRKEQRETDVAARYGGEEFVVLLPETDCVNAGIVAERMRRSMEDSPVHTGKGAIRFTASFGVAGRNESGQTETFDQLISQADQALYKAKRAGRNQVVGYSGE